MWNEHTYQTAKLVTKMVESAHSSLTKIFCVQDKKLIVLLLLYLIIIPSKSRVSIQMFQKGFFLEHSSPG